MQHANRDALCGLETVRDEPLIKPDLLEKRLGWGLVWFFAEQTAIEALRAPCEVRILLERKHRRYCFRKRR